MKNYYEQMKEYLQELLEKSEKEIMDAEAKIKASELSREQALRKITEAEIATDVKAYGKALEDKRTAEDIKELYQHKLKRICPKPLISKDEYNAKVSEITSYLDQYNREKATEVKGLVEELKEIAEEVNSTINQWNELLHTLQHKIFKDDATMITGNGTKVHMEHLEQKYEKRDVAMFCNHVVTLPTLAEMKKKVGV